ncbi:MAG: glycosyltransferase, partial [Thermomicrobiales bacterium]
PVPADVNGKAHNLQTGYLQSSAVSSWILTLDADVRPDRMLVRSLLAHAASEGVNAFSVATRQRLSGPAEALVHPSMLATLVYRQGIPGQATTRVDQVQANGQCFLLHRSMLNAVDGFSGVKRSINEDVTLARAIATAGNRVGFYESDDLITVEMYAGWRDAWQNWTRSLPMRDRFSDRRGDIGLAEILLVQALPPWVAAVSWWRFGRKHPLTGLNLALVIARIGVLQGIARAYEQRPWTYWLSPLCDLPVVMRIAYMSRRKRHVWRGRTLVAGDIR